jgi:hypothetical protein
MGFIQNFLQARAHFWMAWYFSMDESRVETKERVGEDKRGGG